jgi:hypothetical protein
MSKLTLLEIVQDILSDMESDNVNSIDDTPESEAVAKIVKSTYQAMMSNRNWPHTMSLVKIDASTDNTKPTIMTFGEKFKELISVFYNKARLGDPRLRFEPVKYISPDDMLRLMYGRNTDAENVETYTSDGQQVLVVLNNQPPSYYTSFDDQTLFFDSYDKEVDDTLQSSKTQVRAYITPDFIITDSFIPDLPEEAFSYLLEESKSKAMFRFKQTQDGKAEQDSRRQNQWLSRKNWTVAGGVKYARFGRGTGASMRDPTFKQGR